jgi:nicotinate-nucleotide adenylyltransferase
MIHGSRIGILGGTFDPVHLGHVETAAAAARALTLDRVLLMPSGTPPHRHQQPAASRFHRFAMVALAVTGQDRLAVSDLEIDRTGPSYTYDTLRRLHESGMTASQIFFITGADAFAEIETWHRYPDVLEMAQFVVVSRPGHPAERLAAQLPALAARLRPAPGDAAVAIEISPQLEIFLLDARTPDISSTEIRRRLGAGGVVHGLMPAPVETYIRQHGLYSRAAAPMPSGRSLA